MYNLFITLKKTLMSNELLKSGYQSCIMHMYDSLNIKPIEFHRYKCIYPHFQNIVAKSCDMAYTGRHYNKFI